ncbi:MAG: DUF3126 family protein [Alphaproteobacteria bacterium]
MDPKERTRVETYLRKTFNTPKLELRTRPKKDDSAEVYINDEFLASSQRTMKTASSATTFTMTILDLDLEEGAS